jgi:hypothetical protein
LGNARAREKRLKSKRANLAQCPGSRTTGRETVRDKPTTTGIILFIITHQLTRQLKPFRLASELMSPALVYADLLFPNLTQLQTGHKGVVGLINLLGFLLGDILDLFTEVRYPVGVISFNHT